MQKTISTKIYIATMATIAALLASVIVPTIASARPNPAAQAAKPGNQTIAEIASTNGNFTTLVAALECTGLLSAVTGTKQLTVFAPTDAAFANVNGLNADTICDAFQDKADLANILLYHVTEGRRNSTSVLAAPSYRMLNGDRLTRGELLLNPTLVNISASNGIIHVVDRVLLP